MTKPALFRLKVADLSSANPAMQRCLQLAALAARSDIPALILGPTGTGKTLLAQAIHNSSARHRGPFVSFNSSALSDTLLESELFGHERGAFTGAQRTHQGRFEKARDGTLFFDEIADMSAPAQAKILRAVEYGEFERVGGERLLHSNARILSATNVPLADRIAAGRFRGDLYHRLNGLVLTIPPLRDRPEDLPALIALELRTAAAAAGKSITAIHPAAMDVLLRHGWPGNLRELHQTLRSIALFCDRKTVLPEHVHFHDAPSVRRDSPQPPPAPAANIPPHNSHDTTLQAVIRRHVRGVYLDCGKNQRQAARLLGISRGRLARLLSPDRHPSPGPAPE